MYHDPRHPKLFSAFTSGFLLPCENSNNKKEGMVRDIRCFRGKFNSVVEVKVKLMEESEDLFPATLSSSVAYFEG